MQHPSPSQLRAARAILNWSRTDLAAYSGISEQTIHRMENDFNEPSKSTKQKIADILENAGIELIGDRGVALRIDHVVTLNDDKAFIRVLDDVIATLRGKPKPEALFTCVCDKVSPPTVIEKYRVLRKAGISMRSLIKDGDTYLMGAPKEYRLLPKQFFHNNAVVIYGDKLATMILDPITQKDKGAVIIHNPHVTATQRNLFNLIWSNSKMPRTTTADEFYDQ